MPLWLMKGFLGTFYFQGGGIVFLKAGEGIRQPIGNGIGFGASKQGGPLHTWAGRRVSPNLPPIPEL